MNSSGEAICTKSWKGPYYTTACPNDMCTNRRLRVVPSKGRSCRGCGARYSWTFPSGWSMDDPTQKSVRVKWEVKSMPRDASMNPMNFTPPPTKPTTFADPVDMTDKIHEIVDVAMEKLGKTLESQIEAMRPLPAIEITAPVPIRGKKKIDTSERHMAYLEVMDSLTAIGRAFLVGPMGSGKSSLARDIARDLGLKFGFIACTEGMSEAHLLGRMTAAGAYITTLFIDIWENGGLWLFDEVDAADANTTLTINDGLANGTIAVPNRPKKPLAQRHEKTIVICAANTYGTGNSVQFAGRNTLDAAFLDRFVGATIDVEYDTARERAIAEHYDTKPLLDTLWSIRANVQTNQVRRGVSTRAIIHLSQLRQVRPEQYTYPVLLDKFFKGWTPTERAKAMSGVVVPS